MKQKVYILTKYGTDNDCSGYFSSRKEDLERTLAGFPTELGFRIEEKFLSDKFEV